MSLPVEALANELRALIASRQFSAVVTFWETRGRRLHADQVSCRSVASVFAELGQLGRAMSELSPWLKRIGYEPETFALAGRVALDLGRSAAAVSYLMTAVSSRPGNVMWWGLLADAALAADSPASALKYVTPHRLRFNDDDRLAYLLIQLLIAAGRTDEALLEFERALARWPGHLEMGCAFARFVTFEYPLVAAELLDRTHWAPSTADLTASWVKASLAMPAFHGTDEAAASWQQRILRSLHEVTDLAIRSPLDGDARALCLNATMFLAPYTEQDVTELMFAWGDFVEALVAPLRSELPWSARFFDPNVTRPLRSIGFVTNRGPDSSAGRLFHAWVEAAARSGLVVHVFALGSAYDGHTTIVGAASLTRFPNEHPQHWREVANQILAANCDMLIYPEPQGSSLQILLLGIKLAARQAVGFGNPVTTGLQTVDYFLAPAEAEASGSERHYRECLVRLRDTWSLLNAAPAASLWSRAAFGGDDSEHWYLVTQPMMKWTPRFRAALISILQLDPQGRLVYVQWSLAFSPRAFELLLRDEFAEAGLCYAERVVICGYLAHADYLALCGVADVALDTFGFSGGVSTADALASGLPVVTLLGEYLRGRQSAALVERYGLADHVVTNMEDFVFKATFVARQESSRRHSGTRLAYRLRSMDTLDQANFSEWLESLNETLS